MADGVCVWGGGGGGGREVQNIWGVGEDKVQNIWGRGGKVQNIGGGVPIPLPPTSSYAYVQNYGYPVPKLSLPILAYT